MFSLEYLKERKACLEMEKDKALTTYNQYHGAIAIINEQINILEKKEKEDGQVNCEDAKPAAQE